ncbi:restriction endonuclease subunit S [Treponema sp. UBA6852]|uniref:restriction endonuclease subunit S n=1 Tax=Treponema sp. UBA6852 TaxID=1947744 RepID=UPI0025F491EF|nr:restriction endonuclease subunit S [Treponema sp. UBA6852]
MKDSGIDWIGKIPDEWTTRQIRYLFEIRDERNYKPLSEVNLISVYTDKGVLQHNDIEQTTGNKAQNADGYKHVYKNDLVVNIILCWMGALGISDFDGVTSPAYDVYSPKNLDLIFPKYYHYLFRTPQFNGKCYTEGRGIMQMRWRTYSSEFKSIKVPFPPLSEQTKIAGFLDKKCSEIDSIIEESKKSIEEYKAWKQSVIFEAVTGKNLSCKKKNSGIEWLGEIPENFTITRIKHIATLAGRIGWQGLTSQEYSDEGCYLITGINFSNGEINWESCVRVPYSRWEEAAQIQVNNGDLLITKDGTVGKVAIVNNMPDKTSLNSGVLLIRQNKKVCSTRFLFWILQSNIFWKWFNYINAGNSTIIHLYQHDFSNFSFPNPSIKIQNEISNYLDKKCAQIDSLISEKQSLIKDLAEYKKSLIFEAVTGKRRV